ncbi:MAG: VCBS repeat-containing protein [Anaerolineae bacterium]|nr:VCBS repeat-containing protein [Anaerolineae bacterium]
MVILIHLSLQNWGPPEAYISRPAHRSSVAGQVPIQGTVRAGRAGDDAFHGYTLYWQSIGSPDWHYIADGNLAIVEGTLGTWDVGNLPDGLYALKVESVAAEKMNSNLRYVYVRHTQIRNPKEDSYLQAQAPITIAGTASHAQLISYTIQVGYDESTTVDWSTLLTSEQCVLSDTLGVWLPGATTPPGRYRLRLRVFAEDYQGEDSISIVVDPDFASGWPQQVHSRLSNESLAVEDLDGDGTMEVIATEGLRVCGGALEGGRCGSEGMRIYVWDAEGKLLPGWPQMPGSDNWLTAPVVADLDGNGNQEIIVGSADGFIYVYSYTGQLLEGWPRSAGTFIRAAPSCGDLDGDGSLEIVSCDQEGHISAWRKGGSPLEGWPQDVGTETNSPLLCDLNGDGRAEVLVATKDGDIWAWYGDGQPVQGWPQRVEGRFLAAPVAGDLDGDGQVEIVTISTQNVYLWTAKGDLVPGWPVSLVFASEGSSPALVDLDGDGDLEIIWVDGLGNLQAWHHEGTPVFGWGHSPKGGALSSPVVGDLDGDGAPEVVVVGNDDDEYLYIYKADGSPLQGWPRLLPTRQSPYPWWDRRTSAILADLDRDDKLELGVGVESYVYFWNMQGTDPLWPTFQGNMWRTGTRLKMTLRSYLPLLYNYGREVFPQLD